MREAEENHEGIRDINGAHKAPFHYPDLDTPPKLAIAFPVEPSYGFDRAFRAATINHLEFALR